MAGLGVQRYQRKPIPAGGEQRPRFLLELEVDGVPVDPREPQYWWPDPDQPPGPTVDVSHWRELGATTDEVPAAFRRRPARGEAPGARERGQLV
jgi:hypothetical protein